MKRHIYPALVVWWSLGVTRGTYLPRWWYVSQSDSLTVESVVPRPLSLVARSRPLTQPVQSLYPLCMYIGKRHIWGRVLPFGLVSHRIRLIHPNDRHLSHCLHSMKRHIYQALVVSWSLGVTRCTDLPLWWYVIQSYSLTVESIVPRTVSLVTRSHAFTQPVQSLCPLCMYIGERHTWRLVLPFDLRSYRIQTNSTKRPTSFALLAFEESADDFSDQMYTLIITVGAKCR